MYKNRIRIVAFFMVLFALALNVSVVFAAKPLAIHIEVTTPVTGSPDAPFDASGPAVDDGFVCASGTVEDLGGRVKDLKYPYRKLWLEKRFHCDDGSGTYLVSLIAKVNLETGYVSGKWHVVDGTGDYQKLHGNGKLYSTPVVLGETVHDVYDGKLH